LSDRELKWEISDGNAMRNKVILVSLQEGRSNPPLGLGYLASYYEKYRQASDSAIEIQIHSPLSSSKRIVSKLKGADLVGISTWTQNFNQVLALCAEVKKRLKIPVILGGQHISALPHTLPTTADIAVIGEGEQTFLELLEGYSKHRDFAAAWLQGINGIVYWDGKDVRRTERRGLLESLDQIPPPARTILPLRTQGHVGYGHEYDKKGTTILTSRGCPYACSYCSSAQFWGRRIRCHSPEYVIAEMEEIIGRYKVDTLCIEDDLFVADRHRLREIVEMVCARGINQRVSFELQCRANLMDEEIAELLKRMNTRLIAFGFESGCEKILRSLKGGSVTVAHNRRAIELCRKYGFQCRGQMMIGNPGETREDLMETINFIREVFISNPDPNLYMAIVLTLPLPGSVLWDYAKEKGLVSDLFMDWDSLGKIENLSPRRSNGFKSRVFLSDQLSREEAWKLVEPLLMEMEKAQSARWALSFRLSNLPLYFQDFRQRPKEFLHQAWKVLPYLLWRR